MSGKKNLFWNFCCGTRSDSSQSTYMTLYVVTDLDVEPLSHKAEDIFTPHYLEITSNLMSEKMNWAFWQGKRVFLENEFENAKTALNYDVSYAVIYKLQVPKAIISPKFLEKKEGPVILSQHKTKKTASSKITIEAVFFSPRATFIDLETFALKEEKEEKEDSKIALSYKRF